MQATLDCDDQAASPESSQAFVTGPGTPPAGVGSLEFDFSDVADDSRLEIFMNSDYAETELDDLEGLQYSTFVRDSPQNAPYFVIYVDPNGDGNTDDEVGLVFYPSRNGTSGEAEDVWQTWDLTAADANFNIDGDLAQPTMLADYRTANPDAEITDLSVEYGCDDIDPGSGGTEAAVDKIVVDVAGVEADTYDLEPKTENPQTGENGYRMVAADGGIFTFGERTFRGSTGSMVLNKPIVGGATDLSDYDGYWIVASDGGVFTFNAEFHGSLASAAITSPAVEIEPTPSGKGYWIVQANGKVTAFGDAKHFGDMATKGLNKPVIGMSVTPTGFGYWLVAEDGGIFSFGDAEFFGSMGDKKLNAPVIDLAPMPDGEGYYLVAKDGGVFTFGTAIFKGSTGSMTLNQPVIAMLVSPNGTGYWLAASDGGIFTFGNVNFLGSMGHKPLNAPVLDLIN